MGRRPPPSRPPSAPPAPVVTLAVVQAPSAPRPASAPGACTRAPRATPAWWSPGGDGFALDASPVSLLPAARVVARPRPAGRAVVVAPPFPALHGPRMVSIGPALLASDIIVAAGIIAAALAARVASGRRGAAAPPAPAPLALESEAAARRLRARFAGALDGGTGVGSIGDRVEGGRARSRRAEWRAFSRRSRLDLVDADAWAPAPE